MDQKELFERLEELELEDFEVKEAKTSIPKSSFETVSAFSNTNGWKAYYENEPVSLNVVDFYKIASPLVKITKASEKTMEKVGEKGVEKLSEKENIILRLIKDDPKISKQEMSTKGELTKKSVEYNITLLKRKGVLRRVGADRGGYWEVVEG